MFLNGWINYMTTFISISKCIMNSSSSIKEIVDSFIIKQQWTVFNPSLLTKTEKNIYDIRLDDVKDAFHQMNLQRMRDGRKAKTVSNMGEIATISACIMINARVICSNDFDIREIVKQEDYRVLINDQDVPLMQESAEDSCISCLLNEIATRKDVRNFYKMIIVESPQRELKLQAFNHKLDDSSNSLSMNED